MVGRGAVGVGPGEAALRVAVSKWRGMKLVGRRVDGVDEAPACVYGVVLGERVDEIAGDIRDIKSEIAWIRRVIVTTVVAAAVATMLRWLGWVP